jgi:integrase
MALCRRGEVWHYDFTVDGRRFRGTTKEIILSKARQIEAKLMVEAKQRKLTVQRRTQTLAEFSKRFLKWVKTTRLEPKTIKYYGNGSKMLLATPIADMRLAHITTDEAEALRFDHSPANSNCALRTLRRMLGKAAEWGLIAGAPRIKLVKEEGRSAFIDAEAELKLLAKAEQPLRDVLTIMLDSGMRPGEVFQMRWEDIAWDRGMIFIPRGKTKRSRRHVPMSDRVTGALHLRRTAQAGDWVFPSRASCGHITTVRKQFEAAREASKLPKGMVLYCARHGFATKLMGATGDLSLVRRALGHTNAQTAMIYQHPSLETVRSVVNGNHLESLSRHNPCHTTIM